MCKRLLFECLVLTQNPRAKRINTDGMAGTVVVLQQAAAINFFN